MTSQSDPPCKGSCKGSATVHARVYPSISARLQGLQRFCVSLPHMYARAHAQAHVLCFTYNPCNYCNPCNFLSQMAVFRHIGDPFSARVAQRFATERKRWLLWLRAFQSGSAARTPPHGSFWPSKVMRGAKPQPMKVYRFFGWFPFGLSVGVFVMIGSLTDLSRRDGMPSEVTLRKIIAKHREFPIIRGGRQGRKYQIDLEEAERFIHSLREKRLMSETERRIAIKQLGLSMLASSMPNIEDER